MSSPALLGMVGALLCSLAGARGADLVEYLYGSDGEPLTNSVVLITPRATPLIPTNLSGIVGSKVVRVVVTNGLLSTPLLPGAYRVTIDGRDPLSFDFPSDGQSYWLRNLVSTGLTTAVYCSPATVPWTDTLTRTSLVGGAVWRFPSDNAFGYLEQDGSGLITWSANAPVRTFNTIAEAIAAGTNAYRTNYMIASRASSGDGGGGVWYYDATDGTTATNRGTVVAMGNGRLKRIFSGPLDVRWFGAKGDTLSDDTDAIQNAVDVAFLAGGGSVYVPSKGPTNVYRCDTIQLRENVEVRGDGFGSALYNDNDSDCLSIVASPTNKADNITIRDLSVLAYVDGIPRSASAGAGIRIDMGTRGSSSYRVTVDNVRVRFFATNYVFVGIQNSRFHLLESAMSEGDGMVFLENPSDTHSHNVITSCRSIADKGTGLLIYGQCAAFTISDYFSELSNKGLHIAPNGSRKASNLTLDNVFVENSTLQDIDIRLASNLIVNNMGSYQASSKGYSVLYLDSIAYSHFNGLRFTGTKPTEPAGWLEVRENVGTFANNVFSDCMLSAGVVGASTIKYLTNSVWSIITDTSGTNNVAFTQDGDLWVDGTLRVDRINPSAQSYATNKLHIDGHVVIGNVADRNEIAGVANPAGVVNWTMLSTLNNVNHELRVGGGSANSYNQNSISWHTSPGKVLGEARHMYMDSYGWVKIGSSGAPTEVLDVAGNIKGTGPDDGGYGVFKGNRLYLAGVITNGSDLTVGRNLTVLGTTARFNGVDYVMPSAQGTNGQVMVNNGYGVLSWATQSGGGVGGAVSSVFGRTGDVTASAGDYSAHYQGLSAALTQLATNGTNYYQVGSPNLTNWSAIATGDKADASHTHTGWNNSVTWTSPFSGYSVTWDTNSLELKAPIMRATTAHVNDLTVSNTLSATAIASTTTVSAAGEGRFDSLRVTNAVTTPALVTSGTNTSSIGRLSVDSIVCTNGYNGPAIRTTGTNVTVIGQMSADSAVFTNGFTLPTLSMAANDMLVWTGSAWTKLSAPTGVEATGSRLYFGPTGPAWVNARSAVDIYDDFAGFESLTQGGMGWYKASGTGGAALYGDAGQTGCEAGNSSVTAGTGDGGYGYLAMNQKGFCVGRGYLYLETRVRFAAVPDGTDQYSYSWGLQDKTSGSNNVDGVFFRVCNATNSGGYGNVTWVGGAPTTGAWECWTCKGGASNWVGTATVPASTTWYRLGIAVAADASTATYYVDGTPVATNSTAASMPTTVNSCGPEYHAIKHSGSTARSVYADYFRMTQINTTTR